MRRIVDLALILSFTTSLWAGPFMGEYEGTFHADSKVTLKAVGKVVDEGDRHRVVLYTTPETPIDQGAYVEISGQVEGSELALSGLSGGYGWKGQIKDGTLSVKSGYGQFFEMKKIESKSPNAGLKPPENAVIVLAYQPDKAPDLSNWTNDAWVALPDGSMQITPKRGANRTKQRSATSSSCTSSSGCPWSRRNAGRAGPIAACTWPTSMRSRCSIPSGC